MNLVKWENNRIEISPEAYAIKSFRNIWNRDKSKDKSKAILELSTLYFMYDPRSEFQYEVDEKERIKIIIEQTGLPKTWKPDKAFEDAVEDYKYLTNTTAASILEGNRVAVNSIRKVIETPIEELNLNPNDKLSYVEKLAKTVSIANKLAEDIAKAEKEIHKDVEEHSAKIRGRGIKTIGDEGLGNLFTE